MNPDTKSEVKNIAKTTGAAIAVGAALVGAITYVSLPAPPIVPWVEYSWTNGSWKMPYGWLDKYPQTTGLEGTKDFKQWSTITNLVITNRVNNKWTIRMNRTNQWHFVRAVDHYD